MKKHLKTLFAALLVVGALASCNRSDVDELNIEAPLSDQELETGGGHGGDDKIKE